MSGNHESFMPVSGHVSRHGERCQSLHQDCVCHDTRSDCTSGLMKSQGERVMRTYLFAGALLGALAFLSAAAFADDMPARKPGLWQIDTLREGSPRPLSIKQCIDASTASALSAMGEDLAGKAGTKCSRSPMKHEGSSYISDSSCTFGSRKTSSHIVMSGDSDAQYRGTVSSTFDPPIAGKSQSTMTITGTWLGPCEPGQVPGDMIMGNGMKMNLGAFQKRGGD